MKPPSKPRLVYSTNPEQPLAEEEDAAPPAPPPGTPLRKGQSLLLALEKRPGGKVVTRISGFDAHPALVEEVAKTLKTRLGTGGTVEGKEIALQGDRRDAAAKALEAMGHKARKR